MENSFKTVRRPLQNISPPNSYMLVHNSTERDEGTPVLKPLSLFFYVILSEFFQSYNKEIITSTECNIGVTL